MAEEDRDPGRKAEGERTRPPAIQPDAAAAETPKAVERAEETRKRGVARRPRSVIGKVMARERPGALPEPARRDVAALTPQTVLDKWTAEAAGIHAVERNDNVITLFGMIGEDFWSGEGISARKVSAQLRAIGDRDVEVQINSPGGDMFEGIAIYNVLREHPQKITVKVMGMAASAASIIAMAGDTIQIGAASFLMIHNCWVVAIGNRHDMEETSAFLEPFDSAMAAVYAARTGKEAAAVAKWMDDETYMSGSVAIERGFADELLPSEKMTKDDKTKEQAKQVNDLRAMELQLVHAGLTRTEARDRINRIKGTPGAAPEDDTPGAVDDLSLIGDLAGLRDLLRSQGAHQ
ncbi:head maturation protease, ClpP-related [Methylopila sp. Yamaguchi]|uniref:head maturation protease, ClpP-related n=1 Tax=Methylopila sp. Yamaguchi TaxID=1437817 RepID=UPI000CB5992E|nr:head maturation protease, ClpP-related [Methylopila sp. Yamaguchi]GBD48092.1 peptidase S14 ClpP [Methylopila sp. Yamaguchi]